jgi:hypothetical protein
MPKKITRQEIYELFSRAGYRSPAHGLVLEIAPAIIAAAWEGRNGPSGHPLQQGPYKEPQLVIYLDDYATGGAGMILVPAQEAIDKYPGNYCSEYLHGGAEAGASEVIRQLQIGNRRWLLKYQSANTTWGTDLAEREAMVLFEQEPAYMAEIPYAVWAVDFIQVPGYGFLAVDFTFAPSTEAVEKLIGAEMVAMLEAEGRNHFRLSRNCSTPPFLSPGMQIVLVKNS